MPEASEVLAALRAALDDLERHHDTSHPFNDGYTQALDDIRAWIDSEDWE